MMFVNRIVCDDCLFYLWYRILCNYSLQHFVHHTMLAGLVANRFKILLIDRIDSSETKLVVLFIIIIIIIRGFHGEGYLKRRTNRF